MTAWIRNGRRGSQIKMSALPSHMHCRIHLGSAELTYRCALENTVKPNNCIIKVFKGGQHSENAREILPIEHSAILQGVTLGDFHGRRRYRLPSAFPKP